ncbi:hypothetical protein ACFWOJ_24295 [Streptomyces sp. NPDC058439]|uniref:hypothetical protein n=1 Tax=Streptomyces sp. NPDC058439 TaxID=3346500 RepID=UPI003650A131
MGGGTGPPVPNEQAAQRKRRQERFRSTASIRRTPRHTCGGFADGNRFRGDRGGFCLHRHIVFGTRVTSVRPLGDGGWEVVRRRRGGVAEETRRYTEVVANGHHGNPRLPASAVPGAEEFGGTAIHSHDCTLSVVHDRAFARGADLPGLWLTALAELEAVV